MSSKAISETTSDPDVPTDDVFLALPPPPRRQRTVAVTLMSVATIASIVMAWPLLSEAAYATHSETPSYIDDLANPSHTNANQFVNAKGSLDPNKVISFKRHFEDDTFQLQRVSGSASTWVELRIPHGMQSQQITSPIAFEGRLVPLSEAGLRYVGASSAIKNHSDGSVTSSDDAWLLVDGASPYASRWALAMLILFGAFAVWNAVNVVRVMRHIR